jgi:hypothetical protein
MYAGQFVFTQLLYSAPRCQARPCQPQSCPPYGRAVLPQTFLCSAGAIPSSRPCAKSALPRAGGVKDGAATAKGGLSLTAPSTAACWIPLGPRKFFDASRGALLLFGMDTEALPVWDEEDEAELSEGRPCRCSYGRHKLRIDLASSFVPRGTPLPPGGGNWSLRLRGYLYKFGGAIRPGQPPPSSSGTPCHQPRCGA